MHPLSTLAVLHFSLDSYVRQLRIAALPQMKL